jgi:hypothetical protein
VIAVGGDDRVAATPAARRAPAATGAALGSRPLPELRDEEHDHVDAGESENDPGQVHHLPLAGVRLAAAQLVSVVALLDSDAAADQLVVLLDQRLSSRPRSSSIVFAYSGPARTESSGMGGDSRIALGRREAFLRSAVEQ